MTGGGTSSSASRARRRFSHGALTVRISGVAPKAHRGPRSDGQPPSFLADIDVGRVRMFHPYDVITGIDVVNLAGDATRQIREKIYRGVAHLLDGYAPPERALCSFHLRM